VYIYAKIGQSVVAVRKNLFKCLLFLSQKCLVILIILVYLIVNSMWLTCLLLIKGNYRCT